jgi:hemerythrin-like domain-containing protein
MERSEMSRSKSERIMNKMDAEHQSGRRRIKRVVGGLVRVKREDTLALAKVYSCSSRARGLLNV